MTVGCNVLGVATRRIVHKLAVLWSKALQAALDDMVAIQVSNKCHHTSSQGVYHQPNLQCASHLKSDLLHQDL